MVVKHWRAPDCDRGLLVSRQMCQRGLVEASSTVNVYCVRDFVYNLGRIG